MIFDMTGEAIAVGINTAKEAVAQGKVICLPTDTVYGIGADPFNADAITALLAANATASACADARRCGENCGMD